MLSWPVVVGCICSGFGFGLLWLLLLRLFAHAMVWGTIVAFGAGLCIGTYFIWATSKDMRASRRYSAPYNEPYTQQADLLGVVAYITAALSALYLLVVCVVHRKIIIAVKVGPRRHAARGAIAHTRGVTAPTRGAIPHTSSPAPDPRA